ncbi:MAG: hypothetical protein ACI9NI_000321 [Olleya marilimosa]|jgi:hypothetical protein
MSFIFKKKISYLISGLVFLAYAFYRLYQFYNEATFNPVRLIIALVFFGYGGYAIYTYIKSIKEK